MLDIEREVGKASTKREEKKKKTVKKEPQTAWKPRFIHEVYTQERLLRDAVAQEYLNKYSLVGLGEQTQLISMQESKKKVLHSGSLGEKIADPVAFSSKLVDGRLSNQLAGDPGANLLEAFFRDASDAERPESEPSRAAGRQWAARGGLGKRSVSQKAPRLAPESEEAQAFRYCDPQTGAYYNTLEEFRKIRGLRDLEREQKIEKEIQFLNTFMLSKRKKLNSLINESYD